MCLAIPGKIVNIDRSEPDLTMAKVDFSGIMKDICIQWVDVSEGDLLDYTAFGRDHREGILVTGVEHCGWGTTVYFNLSKN